jgi:hypothetical protein
VLLRFPRLLSFLLLLILELPVVHQLDDRRISVWRNFDQVQAQGDGGFHCFFQRHNTVVLTVCCDEPNWRDTDLPIDTI